MAATVAIDKVYFETLLRRAEFHTSGQDLTTSIDLPMVTIPKCDHDYLLQATQEYTTLKEALYRGGITSDTLAVLVRSGEGDTTKASGSAYQEDALAQNKGIFEKPEQRSFKLSHSSPNPTSNHSSQYPLNYWSNGIHVGSSRWRQTPGLDDHAAYISSTEREDSYPVPTPTTDRPFYQRIEQRTILLKNLSDRVTHKDLVDVIRGGAILDLYLRLNDRSASISFLEGTAAQTFLARARRNDIYIHGKRVELAWNERQFIMSGHVAGKVQAGATRNLVIQGINSNSTITEERIRQELDHIHNLVVVEIALVNDSARISLNSVHNALFARTCMMSRAKYKGMRIEFYPDECAQPLPLQQAQPKKETTKPLDTKPFPMINRFQMLNMDEAGDESGEEDEMNDGIMNDPSAQTTTSRTTATAVA